ncbi:MAG: class I SAM-dependent methyltransferase [Clostridiales bacterium]|nr:class I SAM-dependent methyltransferase [Clostridiales bacterium]
MNIDTIKQLWVPRYNDPKASLDWWNGKAAKFSTKELPTAETSLAMKLIEQENMLCKGDKSLDVGCGCGRFSFALEALGAVPTATDFSPEMIKQAEERGLLEESRISFSVDNWHTLDLKSKGWEKEFDLVLANMTPAIASADSFLKLIEASRGWVLMVKPTRRSNAVFDELLRLVCADEDRKTLDESLAYAFDLAWMTGGQPKLEYQQQVWESKQPLEEAVSEYTNRISSQHELSAGDKEKIRGYLESIAIEGQVSETSHTNIAAMYWKVN